MVLPGSPAGSSSPAPGSAPLAAPASLPPLPQIPSGLSGPAQPAEAGQAAITDRVIAPTRGRHAGGPAAAGQDGANGVDEHTGTADDGPADPDQGASAEEEARPGLPKRVPAASLGENGDGSRPAVRIEENPVTAPAAPQEAGESAGTGTEPGPAAMPAFHRTWSSPTPPGEETE
jgi:hypothetical protein